MAAHPGIRPAAGDIQPGIPQRLKRFSRSEVQSVKLVLIILPQAAAGSKAADSFETAAQGRGTKQKFCVNHKLKHYLALTEIRLRIALVRLESWLVARNPIAGPHRLMALHLFQTNSRLPFYIAWQRSFERRSGQPGQNRERVVTRNPEAGSQLH